MLHTPGIMWHDYSRCYLDLNCGNITTCSLHRHGLSLQSSLHQSPAPSLRHTPSLLCFPFLNVLLITAHYPIFLYFPHFGIASNYFFQYKNWNTRLQGCDVVKVVSSTASGGCEDAMWRVKQRIKHGLSISMVISINPRPLGSSPDLATRGGNKPRLRLDNTQHR